MVGSSLLKRRRLVLPRTERQLRSKLHTKSPSKAKLGYVDERIDRLTKRRKANVEIAQRLMHDNDMWNRVIAKMKAAGMLIHEKQGGSGTGSEDISRLLGADVIVKFDPAENEEYVLAKPLDTWEEKDHQDREEDGDGRRRALLWTKLLNEARAFILEELGVDSLDIDLPGVDDCLSQLKPFGFASCWDVQASYYQMAVSEKLRRLFVFRALDGELYAYTCLPMGFWASAFIMQAYLQAVVELSDLDPEVSAKVYIDNVRFISLNSKKLAEANEKFYKTANDDCSLLLNVEPDLNKVHRKGEFLGVAYDMFAREPKVRLAAKQVKRLTEALDILVAGNRVEFEWFEATMGRVYWATRVLHMPAARYFYTIKQARYFSRKCAYGECPQDLVNLWADSRTELIQWLKDILSSKPAVVRRYRKPRWVLCTDASSRGYGAVLTNQSTGEFWSIGGRWPEDLRRRWGLDSGKRSRSSTAEWELKALVIGVQRWLHLFAGDDVDVLVDSATCIQTLENGRSRSYWMNERLKEAACLNQFMPHLHYVNTSQNPSDEESRMMMTIPVKNANCVAKVSAGDWEGLCADITANVTSHKLNEDNILHRLNHITPASHVINVVSG